MKGEKKAYSPTGRANSLAVRLIRPSCLLGLLLQLMGEGTFVAPCIIALRAFLRRPYNRNTQREIETQNAGGRGFQFSTSHTLLSRIAEKIVPHLHNRPAAKREKASSNLFSYSPGNKLELCPPLFPEGNVL